MKKILSLWVVMVSVFLLSACVPVASAYAKFDPTLAEWVLIGCTVLVGFLLAKASEIPFVKSLLEYFKINEYRLAISAWLAGVIVQFAQVEILDKIPQAWDGVVIIVMQLLVAVLVTLYGFRLLADRGVKGFK